MSSYIHFTEEEKEQARNTDLAALLKRRGETLKCAGSEYEWQSDSGKVTIHGNLWYHQYERIVRHLSLTECITGIIVKKDGNQ